MHGWFSFSLLLVVVLLKMLRTGTAQSTDTLQSVSIFSSVMHTDMHHNTNT